MSLHSPQPTRPSSVSTRTNVHGRQPPSQFSASTLAIFMRARVPLRRSAARKVWEPDPLRGPQLGSGSGLAEQIPRVGEMALGGEDVANGEAQPQAAAQSRVC